MVVLFAGLLQQLLDLSGLNGPRVPRTIAHNHANELIVMLLEGRLRAFSGDREFLLEPGDMVVVPAYVEHRYEALEDSVTVEAVGPG